ncbi:Clp protease N-terminal domain-containing protein [Streptomyces sp. NPDC050997]|uniref:Clp protease N-terminal domain-containing protein n=1 Tax=Streptomyces sp. NPDC050997 TaxID=3155519 RepID=UPI00343922A6
MPAPDHRHIPPPRLAPYSRKAIGIAEERSERKGSARIECEDLLIGLAQVGRGVAATVLTDVGFDPATLDAT